MTTPVPGEIRKAAHDATTLPLARALRTSPYELIDLAVDAVYPLIVAAERERVAVDDLREALISMRGCITTSARDMGEYRVDAWLYAVLVGWDCEDGQQDAAHVHDDICGGDGAMREIAARHGWSPEEAGRARRLRRAVAAATAEEKQDA